MIYSLFTNLFGYGDDDSIREHENGYLIAKVMENSPAYLAGLQPYFDFIIKINDIEMTHVPGSLLDALKLYGSSAMNLTIYSAKTRSYRNLTIRRGSWTGESVLGVNVVYTNIADVEKYVWHILEVYYGSPADIAGLRPYTDYVVASEKLFDNDCAFFELVEENENNPIKLVVYNSETDVTREVTVVPNRNWKTETQVERQESLLGCGIGYGLLHRVPVPQMSSEHPVNPQETDTKTAPIASNESKPVEAQIPEQTELNKPEKEVENPVQSNPVAYETNPQGEYYSNTYQYATEMVDPSQYYNSYEYQLVPNPYHQPPYQSLDPPPNYYVPAEYSQPQPQ